jgi:hypothetical protein
VERTTYSRTISLLSLTHIGRHANDRLLFGRPVNTAKQSSKSTFHSFEHTQMFGFVRWRGDEYGTQTWRVIVAQSGCPGELLTRIPGIQPGAHLLLHAFGKARAKRALRVIDHLSEAHVLHEIAPAYWRHVHLRISRNLVPEPYDPDAFAALARAKAVT